VSVWTEADAQFQQGTPGAPAYAVVNETSIEVYRGVWLKVSPRAHGLREHVRGVLRLRWRRISCPVRTGT